VRPVFQKGKTAVFCAALDGRIDAANPGATEFAACLSAEDAAQLQVKVARVTPGAVIKPRAGGGFDFTEAELEW
jgi:hypothetical protein